MSAPEPKLETTERIASIGDPPPDRRGVDPEGNRLGVRVGKGMVPRWLGPLALVLAVSALYAGTLHHSFHFDDKVAIWDSPIILAGVSWANLREIFSMNRPVPILTFALNYHFGGLETLGYHLVNIAIHALTATLLYFFATLTLRLSSAVDEGDNRVVALFTALIWAAHPLQVQSVTYIVQRMNSLSAMFFLATMLCYIGARRTESRRNRWLFAALAVSFAALAVASKENAAVLPAAVLFYELYFFRNLDLGWLKLRTVAIIGSCLGLFIALAILYIGGTMTWDLLSGSWGYSSRDFTMGQRLLTEARVVVTYLTLFLFPHPGRLNLDHDVAISTSLLAPPTTLLSLLLLLGIAGWSLVRAGRERLFSFCILWLFLCLAIESSVIGLEIIYEHRMYLPSMLTSLLLVVALYRFVRPRRLRVAILCCLVVVSGYWTVVRNNAWASEISLWTDCVQKSPHSARAHVSLAFGYLNETRYDEAIKEFRQAVTIEPRNSNYLNSYSFALLRAGKAEESIIAAQKALEVDPFNAKAYFNLGCGYERIWKLKEALENYTEALRLSLHPDVDQDQRADPAKARQGVESMKKMLSAMEQRRATRP